MITESQITEIGRLNQPHGIKGEINAVAAKVTISPTIMP